jgi:hypothetical protein
MTTKDIHTLLMKIASNNYKITVESSDEEGRKILSDIVKRCLENDYSFRTLFASAKIIIDDVSTTNEKIEEEYNKLKEDTKKE